MRSPRGQAAAGGRSPKFGAATQCGRGGGTTARDAGDIKGREGMGLKDMKYIEAPAWVSAALATVFWSPPVLVLDGA